jgi:Tol biopolymer transport system component
VAPLTSVVWATWFPDGKHLLLIGSEKDGALRLWRQDAEGVRPLSEAGVFARYAGGVVSPDGATVAYCTEDGRLLSVPSGGGAARLVWQGPPGLVPVSFGRDGRTIEALDGVESRVYRVEVEKGRASVVRELRPLDAAGVIGTPTYRTTAEGTSWVYSYARLLSELYLVEGLR